jgi:beta-galactosidase
VGVEHGGHADTRWVRLATAAGDADGTSATGFVLAADGDSIFQFSALHNAPEDLDTLAHTHQIRPRPETILIADVYHRGIGTAACGPDAHPRWVRGGGTYRWSWFVAIGDG